jgi:hypothetical protein
MNLKFDNLKYYIGMGLYYDLWLDQQVHASMADCNNSIVADRIAITSNLGNHSYRLQSTLLHQHGFSYSTCASVLIFSNVWNDLRSSSLEYFQLPMDITALQIIDELKELAEMDTPSSPMGKNRFPMYTHGVSLARDIDGVENGSHALVPIKTNEKLRNLSGS